MSLVQYISTSNVQSVVTMVTMGYLVETFKSTFELHVVKPESVDWKESFFF